MNTMELCSVMKKNEIKSFGRQWKEVEITELSDINQTQKRQLRFPFMSRTYIWNTQTTYRYIYK